MFAARLSSVMFLVPLALGCGGDAGSGGGSGIDGGVDAGAPAAEDPWGECAGTGQDPFEPSDPNEPLCLVPDEDPPPDEPIAVIEHDFVIYEGVEAVHIRLVLNPSFVDNTYGETAVGWERDHKFGDLVGSDHATIVVLDASGTVVFDLELDYISEDPDAPCGYSSLGVDGGEGKVNEGDRDAILGWATSLSLNLNERGHCDYLENSPVSDESCTPDPAAPDWDFRTVYHLWIARSAFEPVGFGSTFMSFVHASPAKGGNNTVDVVPGECPCPVEVDSGECDPGPGGGECEVAEDCNEDEFCYESHCLAIVD